MSRVDASCREAAEDAMLLCRALHLKCCTLHTWVHLSDANGLGPWQQLHGAQACGRWEHGNSWGHGHVWDQAWCRPCLLQLLQEAGLSTAMWY